MIIQKEIKWPWLKYERKNDNKTLCECKANEEKSLKRTTIMKWANTYAVECSKWQQVHTTKVIKYKSCGECSLLMQCTTCIFGRNRVAILEIKSSRNKTIALLLSLVLHYHLEVQANPPKIVQKTDTIFSIYGRNGTFFKIVTWAFRGHRGQMTINVGFSGCVLKILQSFLKVWLLTSVWQTIPKFWFIWLCYISY